MKKLYTALLISALFASPSMAQNETCSFSSAHMRAMSGKTYYAAPKKRGDCLQGKPCTLKQALGKAKNGDHIVLEDGVYPDKYKTQWDGVTIRAANKHKAILDGRQDSNATLIIRNSNITVSGLTIDGAKKGRLLFIGIPNSPELSNIVVENNRLVRSTAAGIQIANWGDNKPISNILIRHNYISDLGTLSNPGEGIYIGSSPEKPSRGIIRNVEIYGNVIDNFAHNGVDIKPNTRDIRIHHNVLKNQGYKEHHKKPGNEGTFAINGDGNSIHENALINNDAGKMGAFYVAPSEGHQVFSNLVDRMKSPVALRAKPGNKGLSTEVRNNVFCDIQSPKIETANTPNAKALLISGNIGLAKKADRRVCDKRLASIMKEIESLPSAQGKWSCQCEAVSTDTDKIIAPYNENIVLRIPANKGTHLGIKGESSAENDIEFVSSTDGYTFRVRGDQSVRTFNLKFHGKSDPVIKMLFMRDVGSRGYMKVLVDGSNRIHYRGSTSQSLSDAVITTNASDPAMTMGPSCQ